MSVAMEPVDSFLASYAAAVWGRDLDGFMRLYADEVVVFDAWDQTEYRGREAWAPVVGQWFSSLNDEKVEVAFNDVQAMNGSDLAFVSALVTYSGISPEGKRLRSVTNRFTVALHRSKGRWSVAHEHSSLPVDAETGKAVFGS
ncbi:YybH family protein [Paeniglutamicibacter sp. NPDC091659]|uniref:YybH family protein n=1 Tax=Paeniglutamicibacter sp. NPDC091659 TaxID=3364389 RepID=UPI00380FA597